MIALYISLGVFLLICGHFFMTYLIFLKFFGRMSVKAINKSNENNDYAIPYLNKIKEFCKENEAIPYEKVEIKSFDDLTLTGSYYSSNSDKTIIMFHGFHAIAMVNFAPQLKYFLAHKYNVLLINQRAHEGSEGKYSTYGQKEKEDVLSWVSFVSQDVSVKSIYLYGISMGATSIAFASENITDPKVKLLIMESSFTSVDALVNHICTSQHVPVFFFRAPVHFFSRRLAGVKWNDRTTVDALKNNHIPSVFVHGTKDIVAIDSFFEDNYNNCLSNKYKIIVEGAPHALCAYHDEENYLNQLNTIIGENK